jgi:hypothetical protein
MARTGIVTVFFVDARAGTRPNRPAAAHGWSFIASQSSDFEPQGRRWPAEAPELTRELVTKAAEVLQTG